jgi:hypothetical protein
MKNTSKALSVILTILFFVIAISFICFAAEKQTLPNLNKSQTDAQAFKLESIKIVQKAVKKIPASALTANTTLPLNAPKVDLVCSVKVYYDEAKTMPIPSAGAQGGIYHLTPSQSPQRPLPYHAYIAVEVKNVGYKSSAENFTNRVSLYGNALINPGSYMTSAVTLAPGETAVFDYYVGPFYPSVVLKDKVVMVQAFADVASKVAEDNETNNAALYRLTFVWP